MRTRTNTKSFLTQLAVALMVSLLAFAPMTLDAQTVKLPSVTSADTTHVKWTAGTILNGGHPVAVTANSSTVVTLSKTDCSSPGFASCNFVYANSSGTVAVGTTLATAMAAGNTIFAYVETDGSGITKIAYPQQSNNPYTSGVIVVNCGTSATCTSPTQVTGAAFHVIMGSSALATGSPSTVTVSGLTPAFTSTSTFQCTATATTTAADNLLKIANVSGTSFTITGPNTTTGSVNWHCIGY